MGDSKKAIKGKTLNSTSISNLLIPLPPLVEQKRIVARVEELLAKIDELEKDEQKLVALYKEFPGDMKASLLQSAIQGKLVPQIESEGTAEDLYQEIQKEKEHLVKAKVIKNEAALKPIKDDEIPFDIPDTWKWVRLNDLVSKTIKRGKTPSYAEKGKALVFAQKCNTKAGIIALKLAKYLDDSVLPKYDDSEYMKFADIIINSTGGGTMGRVGFYNVNSSLPVVPDGHVTIIRAENMNSKYLYYYLKSCQSYLETLGLGSTNQTELTPDSLKELLIALPPLNEQNRIVAKLEELLPLCEKLTEIIA